MRPSGVLVLLRDIDVNRPLAWSKHVDLLKSKKCLTNHLHKEISICLKVSMRGITNTVKGKAIPLQTWTGP
jgi:hypothetical protein